MGKLLVVADVDKDKTFDTLAAKFALAGYELLRKPAIGVAQSISVVRHGFSDQFADLYTAGAYLAQIGGAP
jgi:hypothetical protein